MRTRILPEKRFWSKVKKTDTCWLWIGGRLTDGYGAFKMPNGRTSGIQQRAHRIAWLLTHGTIPDGQQVLHTCDNPLCVCPDHLFLGTALDNVRDKHAKGRQRYAHGSTHGHAKLIENDVQKIRRSIGALQRELAVRFGVTQTTIRNILHHKTWTHV